MVWVARQDGRRTVELLGQHHPDQPMRPSLAAEGQAQLGHGQGRLGQPVGAADQEGRAAPALLTPCAQPPGQLDASDLVVRGFSASSAGAWLRIGAPRWRVEVETGQRVAAGDTLVAERPVEQASAAPPALTVGFRKPEGWAEPLYVYYWATHPAVAEPGWPGMAMSDAGDGWWTCRIEGAAAADLLFNDHRGNQTGDLRRDRCGRLDRDGRWIDDDPS